MIYFKIRTSKHFVPIEYFNKGTSHYLIAQPMTLSDSSSKIAWQGDSWRLRIHTIALPDGSTIEKGSIEHPGAVVIVPLQETSTGTEVIMLRQYRLALGETILELPAGTRGWQEEWLACAQRELREETGYRADHFHDLGHCWPAPGLSDELMAIFLATGLKADPLPQDGDEIIEIQSISLDDLVEMAVNGQLKDAKSVVGILRTALHLQGQIASSSWEVAKNRE